MKDADITGQRFNRLVAIKFVKKVRARGSFWLCQCDCGNTTTVRTYDLLKGLKTGKGGTKSCGCLNQENRCIAKGQAAFNRVFRSYKDQAPKRGLSFELTKEEFRTITSRPCFYCGSPPSQAPEKNAQRNGNYLHTGIDRIDNSRGYTIDNCVPCCKLCNRAKNVMNQKEFFDLINRIYANHINR